MAVVFKRNSGGAARFSPRKVGNVKLFVFIGTFAIIGGAVALFVTHAATSVVIDTSVPVPLNVKAFPDDGNVMLQWDKPNGTTNPYGYYITWRKKGDTAWTGSKQTLWEIAQIQPLVNGQEYEFSIQTANATYQTTPKGDLTNHDAGADMNWVRATGHVSPAVTINSTPTSARIDVLKQKSTAFFDDFKQPSGAFDELKWNEASHCLDQMIGDSTSSAFVNTQFHAHNGIGCGFGFTATRPRATFDTSVGINGGPVSESNPAMIFIDMDETKDGRSNWYLDLIPSSARKDKAIVDTDDHHSVNDFEEHNDAPNMLRFNVPGHGYGMNMTYWDMNRQSSYINAHARPTVCGGSGSDVDYRNGCDLTRKTLALSPIAEPDATLLRSASNVRRHFVFAITPTTVKTYVDGALVMDGNLPAAFAAEKKFTLINTMFSYNTGKGWTSNTGENGHYGVHFLTHFYHWDNFGFTGPTPTTVVHNYIDGGPDGTIPQYIGKNYNQPAIRDAIVKIPDDIGSPVSAKMFYTLRAVGWPYTWQQGDNFVLNGKTYNVPNPEANEITPIGINPVDAHSVVIPLSAADLRKGDNTVSFHFNGGPTGPAIATNMHIELEYNKSGTVPSYTDPYAIFGSVLQSINSPRTTNCDSYNYIENDIGLPNLNGLANITPAPCELINADNTPESNPGNTPPQDIRNFEAESAYILQGATVNSDAAASKGKYLKF